MNVLVVTLSLIVLTETQWTVPIINSGLNAILDPGQSQPMGSFDGFYKHSPANYYPGVDPLIAQLAPQIAQFGSHYPGYGIPIIPTAASAIYRGSRNIFNSQPMMPPSQMEHIPPFNYQLPGMLGDQRFSLEQLRSGIQKTGYGQFQGDDFMGSIEKPASLPPSQPIRVIPPFMEKQSKEVQDKFYSIVQHPTWSAAEKNAKIEEMIAEMDVDVQNLYSKYQHTSLNDMYAKRQKVHDAVESMSPEAQQQFQKVSALMTSPGLSQQERLLKIQDLYSKISESIKKEFDSKFIDL
ncbi:unnamed protein product [Angiostrongylus costaricensis]|uniref:DUF148 domain-containing protein n=1 Tax=Angiostrongylus costaricensis TaxID=334426 RepID=A0A0R3PZZ6_ANGCS|nr:unnamed protein product [Angiostrongylus costaricensis]